MVHLLLKRTFNLPAEETYADLKTALTQQRCKTISEEPPNRILVKQGSIWGASSKSAKKTLELTFAGVQSGTEVTCQSRLSADWINFTVVGCVFAAALAGICFWMASDLNAMLTGGKAGFWAWLATFNGTVDDSVAHVLLNLTRGLAVFLFVVIVVEAVVVVYADRGIDVVAKEIFSEAEAKSTADASKKPVF
jgi:hypothetical protein